MSWGKAMWRLYKFFVGLSTAVIAAIIIFWVMTLVGCSSQRKINKEQRKINRELKKRYNDELCIDHYHENFYLEDYDYWLCLTSDAVCQIDTFYIAE